MFFEPPKAAFFVVGRGTFSKKSGFFESCIHAAQTRTIITGMVMAQEMVLKATIRDPKSGSVR